MSAFNKWKEGLEERGFEKDNQAAEWNKELKSKNRSNKPRWYKRTLMWFWPVKGERLLSEAITNMLIVIMPVFVIIFYALAKQEADQATLEVLGGLMFGTGISIIIFIFALAYKSILKRRKKKGTYFKEYKRKR